MASYPGTPSKYPVTPSKYPVTPKAYPATGVAAYPGGSAAATTPLTIATANGVSLSCWLRSDLGVLPAGTLLQTAGVLTPIVGLQGSIAAVKGLAVRVNDTTGGTGSGQAKYDYSDDGGATWIETGVTTSITPRSLIGSMTGSALTFPVGTYNNTATYQSVVDGWEDQTGNGHDQIAADYLHAPTIESTGSYTGIPSIRTNGVDQYLKNMSLGTLFTGTDVPFTIWTVFQIMNTASSGVIWNFGKFDQNGKDFHEFQFSSTGVFLYNRIDDVSLLRQRTTPAASADGVRHRHAALFSGTDVSVYQDGAGPLTMGTSADLNVGALALSWFTMGCRFGVSASTFQAVRLNEVIVLPSSASAGMRTGIESYLLGRYG